MQCGKWVISSSRLALCKINQFFQDSLIHREKFPKDKGWENTAERDIYGIKASTEQWAGWGE